MKILLACELYWPSVGGVQEVMRQIGERLVQAGHRVTVATSYLPERVERQMHGVDIEEFRVSGNLVRGLVGEVERYRRYVLRQDYDVLMIKAAQQWTFDALTSVLQDIRRPKVFIPCGFSAMFERAYADYYRAMPAWLRQFDRLIFYASQYRDIDMARRHGLSNLRVVPNGADEREFNVAKDRSFRARYGIPEDAFVVTTVGSLIASKGHVQLAAAFERCDFDSRSAFLLLIGNKPISTGPWGVEPTSRYGVQFAKRIVRSTLEGLGLLTSLHALGVTRAAPAPERVLKSMLKRINSITGKGAVLIDPPRSDVIQAYLNSNLFAFASSIEYSPLVLFEAAAAGLPFLTVPVGNASEIAEWTAGGVICHAEVDSSGYTRTDPATLANAMEQLSRQPELLARLASNGRRAWEERFSWHAISRIYERILAECAEEAIA